MKRDDETFVELLERLVQSEEPIKMGAWSDAEAERAREAARMQDRPMAHGERMPARDPFIAATARSRGDGFVVSDSDFGTGPLTETMDVTDLRRDD